MKQKVINKIIRTEGGYSDDPSDSGGVTKYGITEHVARSYGYTGDMQDLSYDTAYDIYSALYWDSLRLDDICSINEKIAEELADTGVNCGIKTAAIFLQRCLNSLNLRGELYDDIVVDGYIGSKTVAALKAFIDNRKRQGEVVLLRALNSLQGAHYIALAEVREKDEKYVYGWFQNRVEII